MTLKHWYLRSCYCFIFIGGKCRRQYSTTNVQWNSRKYIKKLPAADTKSNLFINHSSFVLCLRIVDLSHNCVILYQTALHKLYLLQIVNVLSFHTLMYLYFIYFILSTFMCRSFVFYVSYAGCNGMTLIFCPSMYCTPVFQSRSAINFFVSSSLARYITGVIKNISVLSMMWK